MYVRFHTAKINLHASSGDPVRVSGHDFVHDVLARGQDDRCATGPRVRVRVRVMVRLSACGVWGSSQSLG